MASLLATLGLDATSFHANADKASSKARELGGHIDHSLGDELKSKLAHLGTLAFAEETIRRTVEWGDQIYNLSRRLGIGVEAVQAWDYALKLNGSSIQNAATFFERMASNRQKALEGSEPQIAAFRRLGVTLEDLRTKRLEDIGLQISKAFEMGDPQKLIADLRVIGGRGAGELAAAFQAGLGDLIEGARAAGVIASEEVINGLKEAKDDWTTIWSEFTVGIAPAVAFITKTFHDLWHDLNVIASGGVGFLTGLFTPGDSAIQAAKDAMHEYDDMTKERERLAAEHREKSKGPRVGGADDIENKAEESKRVKEAKEILKLKDELFKLQEANDLKALSREGQLIELNRRRAGILQAMADTKDEKGKLNAAIDIEKIDEQIRSLTTVGGVHRERNERGGPRQDVNALQKIGAFAAKSGDNDQLATARRMEGHLLVIKQYLAPKHHTGWHGTKF